MALGPLSDFHLLPPSLVAALVVGVVGFGIYHAYTGRPTIARLPRQLSAIGAIVATCIVVFILEGVPISRGAAIVPPFFHNVTVWNGLVPWLFVHGYQWWAPFTQMFVHFDVFHILFNMLFLVWIGQNVEARIGRHEFVVMYLLSGLFATVVTLLGVYFLPAAWQNIVWLSLPNEFGPNIGASGAVYGVIGFAMGAFPHEKVLIPTPIIATYWTPPVAALILIVISFITALFWQNVAWWAHLAGMAMGFVWGFRWRRSRRGRVRIDSVAGWGSGGVVRYVHTYRYR
ncbi:MAG TPA: rhomboid family intramembrane serine protease [Candidatus Thermoplasmatota archaeon]|nr:rhomboid family intramembrane serine protease [Candidatus Thermoplasmatota archaeon]